MRVKELKELLKDAPDDAFVLTEGSDHSYWEPNIYIGTTVATVRPGLRGKESVVHFNEDFEYPLEEDERRLTAVLITG